MGQRTIRVALELSEVVCLLSRLTQPVGASIVNGIVAESVYA